MFSQVFTRAKGIFSKNNLPASDDSSVTARASHSDSTGSVTDDSSATFTNMVTATRQGVVGSSQGSQQNAPISTKRKSLNGMTDSASSKRRRLSPEQEDSSMIEVLSSQQELPQDNVTIEIPAVQEKVASKSAKSSRPEAATPVQNTSNHIRFGSEEPTLPIRTMNGVETVQPQATPLEQESDSDEDEDEAPEVVDNSAQLMSLKVQAQKQKEALKRDEILQKEKRRLQDEKQKAQAKASAANRAKTENLSKSSLVELKPIADDDLISESTATLQGSTTKEPGRRILPALLPDEILNAEPIHRLPSPPPEEHRQNHNRQHKFFKDDKPTKDIHRGDVTIKVLESNKDMLPPKTSANGRNVKAVWQAGKRGRHGSVPGGLKRVAAGSKGFVRR